MKSPFQYIRDLRSALRLPRVSIDLMMRYTRDNDPFYEGVVRDFYRNATSRHPKFPFIKSFQWGVALCPFEGGEEYFRKIEASGRRNVRKARKLNYVFQRINFNDWLSDIAAIRLSTEERQGKLPQDFLKGEVAPCRNPESKTSVHDYPYFGVLKDGRLYSYAGCLISGELAIIEHIYGHADYLSDGIVPLLFAGIANYIEEQYPNVKYYCYGSFFGAGQTMRRFKKKFRFEPHKVKWLPG